MRANHRPEEFRPDVPPGYLPRSSFLLLTDLTVGTYTSLVQRGQMPMMPPEPGAPAFILQEAGYKVRDADLEWFDVRGWAPGSALAFIVAQMFMDQHTCSRDRATAIARGVPMGVHRRWAEVAEAADRLISGRRHANILVAVLTEEKKIQDAIGIGEIGTLAEVAKKWNNPESLIAVSLTAAAATLRRRAKKHGIDISGFWETGR